LLTGWGAPGSASSERNARDGRRSWTCWCAAHRPSAGIGNTTAQIILEFELEIDNLHPLYPLYPSISEDTLSSPPNSTSSEDASTGATPNTGTSPPGSGGPHHDTLQLPLPRTSDNPGSLSGLEGDDTWVPSAEDILESTTSRSKPLLALERLRRLKKGTAPAPNATSGSRPRRRASVRHQEPVHGSVGMMDVFAVMAQINEQLGAAPDLDDFLKVVVGVIKDLTQFHRVMVYQFDESWNGQVVAELVDWSQTHDLYRGLHFPASDIPAQVIIDICVCGKILIVLAI
jgi:hypothetical protein